MIFKWLKNLWPQKRQRNYLRIDNSIVMRERLSIIYAFCATGSVLAVAFAAWKGKVDWADYYGLKTEAEKATPTAQQWAESLGIQHGKVISIRGFRKVDEYDIKPSKIPAGYDSK